MKKTLPVGLLSWVFVVVIASFISWGTLQTTGSSVSGSPFNGFDPFMNRPFSITMTGWQGYLKLAGTAFPNWLVVVTALGAAVLGYIRFMDLGKVNRNICVALLAYGIFHVGSFISIISLSNGIIGFGAILTIVSLIAMMISLFKNPSANQVDAF